MLDDITEGSDDLLKNSVFSDHSKDTAVMCSLISASVGTPLTSSSRYTSS